MAVVTVSAYDKFVADTTVDQMFANVTAGAGTRKGFRIERPDPGTLVVVWKHTPGWAIFLAIVGLLFFLIGLLFLLVKTEDRVTLIGRDKEGGSTYTITGRTDPQFARFIQGFVGKPSDG